MVSNIASGDGKWRDFLESNLVIHREILKHLLSFELTFLVLGIKQKV
jgi:hypothetical protein